MSYIPSIFLNRLREDLLLHRIGSAVRRLGTHRSVVDLCGPQTKNAARFLAQLALWADRGVVEPAVIRELITRYHKTPLEELSVSDYVHLQIAEGCACTWEQKYENAVKRFKLVLAIENELRDKELIAMATFCIGRCYRRLGRYEPALKYLARARDMAAQLKLPEMVAHIRIGEGLTLLQAGRIEESARVMALAEVVLAKTDDYTSRANIDCISGAIACRNGRYEEALHRYSNGIELYRKRNPRHEDIANSMVEIALIKRVIALELRDKLDTEVVQARKVPAADATRSGRNARLSKEVLRQLRDDAFQYLHQAREFYEREGDVMGDARVRIAFGYLYLDKGDMDVAASSAASVAQLADARNDRTLKASARILQSTIERAKCEDEILGRSTPRENAQAALAYAIEAVECAKGSQNARLLAETYIVLASALLVAPSGNLHEAQQACDQAAALLKADPDEYLRRELQFSLHKLREAGGIDLALRELSLGAVGNKTFRQITEEFAAIVVPKVWAREGRKIYRVAARLSMSPKKVRKILRSQGIAGKKTG